jgi:hypothetical protein
VHSAHHQKTAAAAALSAGMEHVRKASSVECCRFLPTVADGGDGKLLLLLDYFRQKDFEQNRKAFDIQQQLFVCRLLY